MRLFADTGGWIALFNPRDKYHASAQQGIAHAVERDVTFITTDYVLDEVMTNLQRAVNHAVAEGAVRWLLQQPRIRLLFIYEEIWDEAWHLFQRYDDKEFSFTDCTSFAVMQQHKLRDAFGYDHHFEQMGFRRWPR